MDVTDEILRNHQTYGGSDNTARHTLAASRSLNYVQGGSISKPAVETLNIIPFKFKYQDEVGLFGAENYFVRINVNIDQNYSLGCFEEPFWLCAEFEEEDDRWEPFYSQAVVDRDKDTTTVNTYEPPVMNSRPPVPTIPDAYISVDLKNLKVNNKYIDDYLDVRLYTRDKEEHPFDHMYVRLKDHFYLGVHARNTRRLPYNLELTIGEELRSGLPSDECVDVWDNTIPECSCIEEPGYVCGEMSLYRETGTAYDDAKIDLAQDTNTVNSYQPARVTLQGLECIPDAVSDIIGLQRRGNVGHVPPPKPKHGHKNRGHSHDPCCATCR